MIKLQGKVSFHLPETFTNAFPEFQHAIFKLEDALECKLKIWAAQGDGDFNIVIRGGYNLVDPGNIIAILSAGGNHEFEFAEPFEFIRFQLESNAPGIASCQFAIIGPDH